MTFFLSAQGTLPWQPFWGQNGWNWFTHLHSSPALAFQNGPGYHSFDFRRFSSNYLSALYGNSVRFGPITPELRGWQAYTPSFSYIRLAAQLLNAVVINTGVCGAISTQLFFTISLGGDTAMPRGLHARLCRAFLVTNLLLSVVDRLVFTKDTGKYCSIFSSNVGVSETSKQGSRFQSSFIYFLCVSCRTCSVWLVELLPQLSPHRRTSFVGRRATYWELASD